MAIDDLFLMRDESPLHAAVEPSNTDLECIDLRESDDEAPSFIGDVLAATAGVVPDSESHN